MPEILAKYPHATLEIIGEGEEREALKSQITNHKLQRHVTLLGRRDHPEDYLKKWDVFVLPSISETFGITILEAMAAQVPVVATKVGGVTDIVSDGKNGKLIKPKSSSEIAAAILDILDHPAEAAKFVRSGKDTVKEHDWSEVIKQVEKLYQGLAKEKF